MGDPWRECRRVIARHSRSFDLASRLLPGPRRDEVAALYGWCRGCDDAIDTVPPSEHPAAIARLRAELEAIYAGDPQADPIQRCFQMVVQRRGLPVQYPRELLAGMEMDVAGRRYATFDDLLVYCWRVAGTVGPMMCHVMGVTSERAVRHAAHLGVAMQLTNVCRDVAEDWQRGRVYLPDEFLSPWLAKWLDEHRGRTPRPAFPGAARPELAGAVQALLARAERYYASADEGMRYLAPRSALAVRTARLVYAEIGRRLEAQGCDAALGRAVVPRRRKLALVGRALRRFWADRRRPGPSELIAPRRVLDGGEAVRLT